MNRYFESEIVEERGSVLSIDSKPLKDIWTRDINVGNHDTIKVNDHQALYRRTPIWLLFGFRTFCNVSQDVEVLPLLLPNYITVAFLCVAITKYKIPPHTAQCL